MSQLDDAHAPYWESRKSFAAWLEDIAAQVRRGDYNLPIEAIVLTKDMQHVDPEVITISRFGEPTGILSEETLKEVAKMSRTAT